MIVVCVILILSLALLNVVTYCNASFYRLSVKVFFICTCFLLSGYFQNLNYFDFDWVYFEVILISYYYDYSVIFIDY